MLNPKLNSDSTTKNKKWGKPKVEQKACSFDDEASPDLPTQDNRIILANQIHGVLLMDIDERCSFLRLDVWKGVGNRVVFAGRTAGEGLKIGCAIAVNWNLFVTFANRSDGRSQKELFVVYDSL